METPAASAIARHGVDAERGFLPDEDPLPGFDLEGHDRDLGAWLERLDELAAALPGHLAGGTVRGHTRELEPPPAGWRSALDERETVRVCTIASFLASGHAHELESEPVDRLPAGVAIPLYETSRELGRKSIAAYDTICLENWRREDPGGGLVVENVEPLVRFTDLPDEGWFVAIHVAIEAAAGAALVASARAQGRVAGVEPGALDGATRDALCDDLDAVANSLERQTGIMERMTEGNEPIAFATEFRPYYGGFDGIVFEGVDALDGEPQHLRGGSGAQSSALPSIDAALGIEHEATPLIEKLGDMHDYMPAWHREVLAAYREGPDLRAFVAAAGDEPLTAAFNRCVAGVADFREVHYDQVIQYIMATTGDTTGTGGTDIMPFLEQLRAETERQLV